MRSRDEKGLDTGKKKGAVGGSGEKWSEVIVAWRKKNQMR